MVATAQIATAPSPLVAKFGIKKANDLGEWGIVAAIYGKPGVGKTKLLSMFQDSPYGGPLLILDVEGGTRTISDRSDIDVKPITEWKELDEFVDKLTTTMPSHIPWKTIGVDNMSEVQAKSIRHICPEGAPQLQHWGRSTSDILLLTRRLRDFGQRNRINIIFIAWDMPEKDEQSGILKADIGFTPSLARQFPGIIDMVGHLTIIDDPPQFTRCLNFAPSPRTAAKFRRNGSESAARIPNALFYDGTKQNPIVPLLATLKGGEPWPGDEFRKRPAPASLGARPAVQS